MTILPFYMPDGRKYENGEIVTFVNDSLKDYLLYDGYIIQYDNTDLDTRPELSKQQLWKMYKKYFKLYQDSIYRDAILMKDIINSISIWEFIQQKYFNSNKSIGLK